MCNLLLTGEIAPNRDTESYTSPGVTASPGCRRATYSSSSSSMKGRGMFGKLLLESNGIGGEVSRSKVSHQQKEKSKHAEPASQELSPSPPCHLSIPVHLPQRVSWGTCCLQRVWGEKSKPAFQVMTWEGDKVPPAGPLLFIPSPWGLLWWWPGPSLWEAPAVSHRAHLDSSGWESGRYEA